MKTTCSKGKPPLRITSSCTCVSDILIPPPPPGWCSWVPPRAPSGGSCRPPALRAPAPVRLRPGGFTPRLSGCASHVALRAFRPGPGSCPRAPPHATPTRRSGARRRQQRARAAGRLRAPSPCGDPHHNGPAARTPTVVWPVLAKFFPPIKPIKPVLMPFYVGSS